MTDQELTQEVLDLCTEAVVRDYERIRTSGVTNMFDRRTVQFHAISALWDFTAAQYVTLLGNYSALMEHYGIERGNA